MDFKENLKEYLSDSFCDDLLSSLTKERTNSLILNTSKISAVKFKSMFSKLEEHPFLPNVFFYDKSDYQFGKSYMFDNGYYYLIDTSSLLVSYYLPTKNDDLILDLCSAPGGKTISLSLFNKDKNLNILANDLSHNRALELSKNIEKIGLGNVIVTNNNFEKVYHDFIEKFDSIILDAPCSGSAMFRKNEEAKKDWSINKVLKLQSTQKSLLKIALSILKKDGYLIYSTCSFSKEENEDVILDALNENSDLEIINLENKPFYYRTKELPQAIHLFPNLYKGEGQFIALLHKKGIKTSPSKNQKGNITHKDILKKFNLNFTYEKVIQDNLYFYNFPLNLSKLNVLRYGLNAGEIKKNIFIPSLHLAHYLSSKGAIKLNDEELKLYLHGDEIQKDLNLKNDFYPVSYNDINVGFVKYTNGKLKNYYPKGLRH